MCSRHEQLPRVIGIGQQWATTNVRQKATVVYEVRGSRSNNSRTADDCCAGRPQDRVCLGLRRSLKLITVNIRLEVTKYDVQGPIGLFSNLKLAPKYAYILHPRNAI